MSPEISIIILTVVAGAGQGLFIWLVGGDLAGIVKGAPLSPGTMIAGAAVSLVLTLVGVAASFFHLTHPERGVKAIFRWKSSWLSREAILLPVFQGLVALYGLMAYLGAADGARLLAGFAGIAAGIALFIASGMIYAKVRFIGEWSTAFTPINFTVIGLASGGAACVAVLQIAGAAAGVELFTLRGVIALTFIGLALKAAYYVRNENLYSRFSLQSAIGVNHPEIRLMDTGAAYDHYNTIEYNHTEHADRRGMFRSISIVLIFIVPLILFTFDYFAPLRGENGSLASIAAVLMVAGAFFERWLFFADGTHAQNFYYGNFRLKDAQNPITQTGKTDAPLPPR